MLAILEEAFDAARPAAEEAMRAATAAIAAPSAPVNQAGEASTRQQSLNAGNGTPTNGVSPIAAGYASKATATTSAAPPRWVWIAGILAVIGLLMFSGGGARGR